MRNLPSVVVVQLTILGPVERCRVMSQTHLQQCDLAIYLSCNVDLWR